MPKVTFRTPASGRADLRVRTGMRAGNAANSCAFLSAYCEKIPLNRINEECTQVMDEVCSVANNQSKCAYLRNYCPTLLPSYLQDHCYMRMEDACRLE